MAGAAGEGVEALLVGNERAVELQVRAGNASSGRDAGQCASQQKKRAAPVLGAEEAEQEPSRFDGTFAQGWDMFSRSASSTSSIAPPKKKSKAAAGSGTAPIYAELSLDWNMVCGWRRLATAAVARVDEAIVLARAYKKQQGQNSTGGAGSSSSSSSSTSTTTLHDVKEAWEAANKGGKSIAFPGAFNLAERKTHKEYDSGEPLVATFKSGEQPASFKCDSCDYTLPCPHHSWQCRLCETTYRVSRSAQMVAHFAQKTHLDKLGAAVEQQHADSAGAPASALPKVIKGDYSGLPQSVVRQVCISYAQSGQTQESSSRALDACAKLANTIRGTEGSCTVAAEVAIMRKHGLHAAVAIVERATTLSDQKIYNAAGKTHVLTRIPQNAGRAATACAIIAKESKTAFVSDCEVVSPTIDETTPPSAASKPVFCCLYACSFLFVWCCTFWATENVAGSSGEQYLEKLKRVYAPFWSKAKSWGMDGCHSMRSTFENGGVDGADGVGKSFLSRLQNMRLDGGEGKTHGYHSVLHWVQLAIADGVKVAVPPEWRKHAGKLGSHFGRSAERKDSFSGLRKAVVVALNVLVGAIAGMAGTLKLAASLRKYVPTRWLSLRRYTQSVMLNWTALWALKQQMAADGWGRPEPPAAAAEAAAGGGGGGGGDDDSDEADDDDEDAGGGGQQAAAAKGGAAVALAAIGTYKIPTAAELVAACGDPVVAVGPKKKRSWIMDPILGLNDIMFGLDALMDTMLAPWAKLQTDLQTTNMPIQHLVASILQNAVNVTEANWRDETSFCGAYAEWRSMMELMDEDKEQLVKLLDGVGMALSKAIIASFKVRAQPYMPFYRAMQLIDPLGPMIGVDGAGAGADAWAAVNTMCETYDNLDIDPAQLRVAVLGERQKVDMLSTLDTKCIEGNLLAYYRSKRVDAGVPTVLKKFAAVVFGTPIETVIVESYFSIYQQGKTGRRSSTKDDSVADGLQLRGVADATGDVNGPFLPEPNLTFDPSAAWEVRMPGLRVLQNIARVEFNVPVNAGTKFRCYAEDWELVKDKRIRNSKIVRERSLAKYIGMYLLDEDDEDHEKRVIKKLVWHKDRNATAAGWTVDTVDADSQDNWAAYHVLKRHTGNTLVDGDVFNDIKRATAAGLNNHRNVVPVERKAAEEEEEKRREEEEEKWREEEGEE